MPPDCKLENLAAIRACCEHMTVVSPNHLEALTLFGVVPSPSADVQRTQIEKATRDIASWMKVGSTSVVRSGGDGVCFCAAGQTEVRWLPAVFGKDEQDKVQDVTGGGNAFLGGLCAGLKVSGGDAYQGADSRPLFASVSTTDAIWSCLALQNVVRHPLRIGRSLVRHRAVWLAQVDCLGWPGGLERCGDRIGTPGPVRQARRLSLRRRRASVLRIGVLRACRRLLEWQQLYPFDLPSDRVEEKSALLTRDLLPSLTATAKPPEGFLLATELSPDTERNSLRSPSLPT